MTDKKTFSMKYSLRAQFGKFDSKDAVIAGEDWGVADSLLIGILLNHGGGTSAMFTLMDGANAGQNDPVKMFTAWALLTRQLAEGDATSPFKHIAKKYAEDLEKITGVDENDEVH